eukprot:6214028-Pleurochrysis_carterae.AAC.7
MLYGRQNLVLVGTVAAEPSRINHKGCHYSNCLRQYSYPISFDLANAALPNSFAIRTAGTAALTSVAPCASASAALPVGVTAR